jgi:hypothetical protein
MGRKGPSMQKKTSNINVEGEVWSAECGKFVEPRVV